MDEKREALRREREIEMGLKLRLIDSFPEGVGEQLKNELKEAVAAEDKKRGEAILKKIGDMIHSRWGNETPTRAMYDETEKKYKVFLSTGTAGTRLMVNTKSIDKYPGDLIFPNVNMSHINNNRTLADVFEELFGDLAENIQKGSETPYYVVKMT